MSKDLSSVTGTPNESQSAIVGRETELKFVSEFLSNPQKHQSLLITGSTGVGKSYFISHIVEALRKQRDFDQIILVSTPTLREPGSLLTSLIDKLLPSAAEIAKDSNIQVSILRRVLSTKRILVMLDGLDELPQETAQGVFDQIVPLFESLSSPASSRLIIAVRESSRIKLHAKHLAYSLQLELDPLTRRDIDELIERRFAAVASYEAIKGLTAFVAGNPFVLNLILELAKKKDISVEEMIVSASQAPLSDRLFILFAYVYERLSGEEKDVLFALSRFGNFTGAEMLQSLTDIEDLRVVEQILKKLESYALVTRTDDGARLADPAIAEFIDRQEKSRAPIATHNFSITFDPRVMKKDDVIQLLTLLNDIYRGLGGGELIIRDSRIAVFDYQREGILV